MPLRSKTSIHKISHIRLLFSIEYDILYCIHEITLNLFKYESVYSSILITNIHNIDCCVLYILLLK